MNNIVDTSSQFKVTWNIALSGEHFSLLIFSTIFIKTSSLQKNVNTDQFICHFEQYILQFLSHIYYLVPIFYEFFRSIKFTQKTIAKANHNTIQNKTYPFELY